MNSRHGLLGRGARKKERNILFGFRESVKNVTNVDAHGRNVALISGRSKRDPRSPVARKLQDARSATDTFCWD
jgi:hypothetical protein